MRFACLFQKARGFSAAECCGFWCRGQRITLGFRFGITAAQISNPRGSIFGTRGPKASFIGKACAARGDGTSLSRQGALRITRGSLGRALFCQMRPRGFHACPKLHQIGCSFARLHGNGARGLGFRQFSADAFQLRGKRCEAVFHL